MNEKENGHSYSQNEPLKPNPVETKNYIKPKKLKKWAANASEKLKNNRVSRWLVSIWEKIDKLTRDRKNRGKLCYIIAAASILLMLVIISVCFKNGVVAWSNDVLLPNTATIATKVAQVIMIIGGLLALATGDFVAIILACIAVFIAAWLVMALLCLILYALIFILINQYAALIIGVAATGAILFLGITQPSASKKIKVIVSAALVAVVTVTQFTAGAKYAEENRMLTGVPWETVEFNGHYYTVVELDDYSREVVEKAFEEYKWYLATISSEEENDFLFELMVEKGYDYAYFGLRYENGDWSWSNGESVSYTNWDYDELSAETENGYYAMFKEGYDKAIWSSCDSTENIFYYRSIFICEWGN
jgi:hypothetical protein